MNLETVTTKFTYSSGISEEIIRVSLKSKLSKSQQILYIFGNIKSTKKADHILEMPSVRFLAIFDLIILLQKLGLRINVANNSKDQRRHSTWRTKFYSQIFFIQMFKFGLSARNNTNN